MDKSRVDVASPSMHLNSTRRLVGRVRSRSIWVASLLLFSGASLFFAPTGCGGEGSSSSSDAGPDVKLPPGCTDLTKDPSERPACVHNDVGMFVAPTTSGGNDDNAGTKESPVATLEKAFGKAVLKSRIYVCSGDYVEAKTVAVTRAVSIYGGFSCPQWEPGKGQGPTNISIKDPGIVLSVSSVSQAITIADIAVTAKNAANAGDSSIAGWLTNSSGEVTLKRVTLKAGAGASAGVGIPPAVGDYDAGAPNGIPATTAGPGSQVSNSCGTETSTGGAGGALGPDGNDGKDGTPKIPARPSSTDNTGAGGRADAGCNSGGGGSSGSYGVGGEPQEIGSALPVVSPSGLAARNAAAGGNGAMAQGGGGGAGKAGNGGGGGAGGCGGKGGTGGQAGGSSVALLVVNTKVRLVESTLAAGSGGVGGPGGQGQRGQQAGDGTGQVGGGCGGGQGGIGGSGGGGNGGAGGSSIALAYVGAAPSVDGTDVSQASTADRMTATPPEAKGGSGGDERLGAPPNGLKGIKGNEGPKGVVQAVVALPLQ